MKRITQRGALAVTIVLALATLAVSAPKSDRASKKLVVEGRVLQVDQKARTLLVSDLWSKKLYLVNVPKGSTYRITFGLNMKVSEPEISHTHRNDRVRINCIRNQEHLAQIDGREVVGMTATR
jgi:hypothetical protein